MKEEKMRNFLKLIGQFLCKRKVEVISIFVLTGLVLGIVFLPIVMSFFAYIGFFLLVFLYGYLMWPVVEYFYTMLGDIGSVLDLAMMTLYALVTCALVALLGYLAYLLFDSLSQSGQFGITKIILSPLGALSIWILLIICLKRKKP